MLVVNGATHLVARIILGFIFIMHGWQKLVTNGVPATADFFDSVGVPLPTFSAYFATWLELIGGILLILGLLMPLVSLLLILDMIGAIIWVHWDAGFWVGENGYELCLALIAGLLAVGFVSAAPTAADTYLFRRRSSTID